VRSLGADRVVDYTSKDFTRSGEQWGSIFNVPGSHSFGTVRRALEPRESYVLIGHNAVGGIGHRWLGSIPRRLGLVALSVVCRRRLKTDQ